MHFDLEDLELFEHILGLNCHKAVLYGLYTYNHNVNTFFKNETPSKDDLVGWGGRSNEPSSSDSSASFLDVMESCIHRCSISVLND